FVGREYSDTEYEVHFSNGSFLSSVYCSVVPMPIEFRCSQCDQLLRVPETAAGKHARCPRCQALMAVPGVATAVALPTEGAAGGQASPFPIATESPASSPPAPNNPFAPLPSAS